MFEERVSGYRILGVGSGWLRGSSAARAKERPVTDPVDGNGNPFIYLWSTSCGPGARPPGLQWEASPGVPYLPRRLAGDANLPTCNCSSSSRRPGRRFNLGKVRGIQRLLGTPCNSRVLGPGQVNCSESLPRFPCFQRASQE